MDVGDTVRVIGGHNTEAIGMVGTIVHRNDGNPPHLVDFGVEAPFLHNGSCDGFRLEKDTGYFFTSDELELTSTVPYSIPSVEHPSHYESGSIACWDAIQASMTKEAFLGYLKGNVMKYLWRYEKKVAPKEDLEKAKVYLEKLIKELQD